MRLLLLLLLLFAFDPSWINAQGFNYYCAWQQEPEPGSTGGAPPCFDIQTILDSNYLIYIKINVHYFVKDDCMGLVQQTDLKQEEVYKNTKEVIKALNNSIKDNQVQKNGSGKPAPWIPIRFVLSGVYIHCETNAIAEYQTLNLNQKYGVNKDTEINFYIAHFPQGATGIGYAQDNVGAAVKFSIDYWWTIGNLYHELGHIFNLIHAFSEDHCDDTPRMEVNWDKNCNGVIDRGLSGSQKESNLVCWNLLSPGLQKGDLGYSDENKNNTHDCDEIMPCTPSPCCDESNIDNNVMSYSANKSAITECQLSRMLNYISYQRCSLVYKIGGCPPTVAFVDHLASDKVDVNRCTECLRFEGSWDEEEYKFNIYEKSGLQRTLVYTSGRLKGPAIKFCYKTNPQFPGADLLLKPNTAYEVELFTFNSCSEDQYTYAFTTNNYNCFELPSVILKINPNPVMGNLVLNLTNEGNPKSVIIWAENLITKLTYPLNDNFQLLSGTNSIDFNVEHMPMGEYVLFVLNANELQYQNFLKL